MKTVILTGFEVFGGYAVNPTKILAESLDGATFAGYHIRSMVFPTAILLPANPSDYGREVIEAAQSVSASVIISLGMSSEVRGLRIETECENWIENDKYCTPFENRRLIYEDRMPHEKKTVPLSAWNITGLSSRLAAEGIPVEISADPGKYCCNALMFRILCTLEGLSDELPFIFAHVPCTEETVVGISDFDRANKIIWSQGTLMRVVEELLGSYIAQ